MPSNTTLTAENFPRFTNETVSERLDKMQSYLYLLLEQLRYILNNLSTENFNNTALAEFVDSIEAKTIITTELISETIVTKELYADYGSIAKLTVDCLRTDYVKARKFLDSDRSDVNYLRIFDEKIEMVGAVCAGGSAFLYDGKNNRLYWSDSTASAMTTAVTEYPVYVYNYTEYTKARFAFDTVTVDDGAGGTMQTVMPQLTFGAGNGYTGSSAKAFMHKDGAGLKLVYVSSLGDNSASVSLGNTDVALDSGGGASVKADGDELVAAGTKASLLAPEINLAPAEGSAGASFSVKTDGIYIDADGSGTQITLTAYINALAGNAVTAYAQKKSLCYSAVSVAPSLFVCDNHYLDYPYTAEIPLAGISSAYSAQVVFSHDDAVSGKYSPVSLTDTGNIKIYAKEAPAAAIVIPFIRCDFVN